MPKPCSLDLRERVLETVASGASRREAAERFEVSASSAIKWMQRWHETGSVAAKPSGGSISPLDEHADFLLALIAEQPDLTLDEIVAAMRKRRIAGGRSAICSSQRMRWHWITPWSPTTNADSRRSRIFASKTSYGEASRQHRPATASTPSRGPLAYFQIGLGVSNTPFRDL